MTGSLTPTGLVHEIFAHTLTGVITMTGTLSTVFTAGGPLSTAGIYIRRFWRNRFGRR